MEKINLAADIGNSGIKLALFRSGVKVKFCRLEEPDGSQFASFIEGLPIGKAIISTVKNIPVFMEDILRKKVPFILVLSENTKLPFAVDYESRPTLGSDRIAAAAGAFSTFPGKNCLIIDAGSAITFDFFTGGRFQGGNISPGIEMRFRALSTFTGRLPLVKRPSEWTFPAKNTHDAIAAGVLSGVVYEINEYIRTFEEKYNDPLIIITGGDGDFLKERIIGRPLYEPDLVINGLNFILDYNAEKGTS